MSVRIRVAFCLAALAFAASLFAAENPFAGTWKLNPAKSKFTGDTTKFEQKASGEILWSSEGFEYTFKLDGEDYPTPSGRTLAWKQLNERTWETVAKVEGKVLGTGRIEISPDGKTMTLTRTGTKPSGEPFTEVTTRQRISGGPGLFGVWKSTKVQTSPEVVEITVSGVDELTLSVPAYQLVCKAQLDGKDYPCTGPTLPAGTTMSLKRSGDRALEWVHKLSGKPIDIGTMKVSKDGRKLTEKSWSPRVKGVVTVAVYEK